MNESQSLDEKSIAVAHGNYLGRGGGEHVAEDIARTFDAPIFYGFGYEEYTPDDIKTQSLFNDIPFASRIKNIYQLRDVYYMYGWRSVPELHDYDIIIQSGNEPGWYKPPEDQVILKYTHSTPRNAYDRYPYRAPDRGLLYEGYCFATEQLYQPTLSYPDLYIANSDVVKRRISKYWGKTDDVRVLYPPVDVAEFGPEWADDSPIDGQYHLVLDRLVPTKHVDEIISAFRERPDNRLVIAGTGSSEPSLKEQASGLDNVTFRGYVPEDEKRALLAGAEALVYAAEDEDFGITPVEALASGTPVIGPREGFTKHQLADGKTGILYDRGHLPDAIERFATGGVTADADTLERVADQYSVPRFRRELREAVADALARTQIETDVAEPPVAQDDSEQQPTIPDGGSHE